MLKKFMLGTAAILLLTGAKSAGTTTDVNNDLSNPAASDIELAQTKGGKGKRRAAKPDGPPKGTIRVTLLGTGGGPAGGGAGMITKRMNATTLVEANGQMMVFDVGRGVVIRLGGLGRGYLAHTDKFFITHLHSDHVTDLPDIFLTGWTQGRSSPMRVWGPTGTKQMMFHIDKAFDWDLKYRVNRRRPRPEIDARDIVEGVIYEEDGVKVTAFQVDHWPPRLGPEDRTEFPAVGYRVDYNGRSVAVSGDTRFSKNLIKFSKGVDIMIHEVHVTRRNDGSRRAAHHTGPDETGIVFNEVNPKLAVYSHIVWGGGTEEELVAETRKTYKGPLIVGNEMMRFLISDKVEQLK